MIRSVAGAVLTIAVALSGCGSDEARVNRTAKPQNCAECHGAEGVSTSPLIPNLAGHPYDYLRLQLVGFRDRRKEPEGPYWRFARQNPTMDHQAEALTDERIRELAARFAAYPCRSAPPPNVVAPVRLDRCESCHGLDGASRRPWAPNLAGQKEAYLRAQMTLFRDREEGSDKRLHPIMGRRALDLDDDEIDAFARYFSSFGCGGVG